MQASVKPAIVDLDSVKIEESDLKLEIEEENLHSAIIDISSSSDVSLILPAVVQSNTISQQGEISTSLNSPKVETTYKTVFINNTLDTTTGAEAFEIIDSRTSDDIGRGSIIL